MGENKNFKIGVFFGSRSPEHDISIITGQLIIAGLKNLGHQVIPVYLDKAGQWYLDERLGDIKFFASPEKSTRLLRFKQYYLDLSLSRGRLVFRKKAWFKKMVTIDLAFPAFHGSYGEDGTIQGLLEIFNVPYVGCDVVSSAITMDKILTKQFYEALGIPTAKFLFFDRAEWSGNRSQILQDLQNKLHWPIFIKPATLGSSIGVAKVKDFEKLEQAIEVALHYSERFLAEESVEHLMDVTVAVIGNTNPEPSLLQESTFQDELFTYEEKYLKEGGAQLGKAERKIIIPARLNDQITKEIRDLAVKIFKLLRCSGIARVDFLYDTEKGKHYANEVNTLPGTLYHHLWKASGLRFDELLTKLLRLAEERHRQKNQTVFTFESDILEHAGSAKLKLAKFKLDSDV